MSILLGGVGISRSFLHAEFGIGRGHLLFGADRFVVHKRMRLSMAVKY